MGTLERSCCFICGHVGALNYDFQRFYSLIQFDRLTGFLNFIFQFYLFNIHEIYPIHLNQYFFYQSISISQRQTHLINLYLAFQILYSNLEYLHLPFIIKKRPFQGLPLLPNSPMTKQSKIDSSNERKPTSHQMMLQSNAPLLPEPAKVIPSIKKSSLISEKQLDEMKIIREFQIKRKLLMKILKQKQKLKKSNQSPIEPFQIKEGVLQFHDFDSQQSNSVSVDQNPQSLAPQSNCHVNHKADSESLKESMDPVSIQSQKIDVAIQTEKQFIKKQSTMKFTRQSTKESLNMQKKISKQSSQIRIKKRKKTKEDIQRLKNQIASIFVPKCQEKQSCPQIESQCQSFLSSLSGSMDEEYFNQNTLIIQKINEQIKAFYKGRYLMEVILNKYKENYNRKKYKKSPKSPILPLNQPIAKNHLFQSDASQTNSKQINQNSKASTLKQKNLQIDQVNKQKIQKQETKNSNTSKKKHKSNRGLLNERFKIFYEKTQPNLQQLIPKNQTLDCIQNQSVSSNNHFSENSFNDLTLQKSPQMFFKQSNTQSSNHYSKAWIREFDMEVQLIYEKYPKLRKYQLSQKISHSQNQHIKIDYIQEICEKNTNKIDKLNLTKNLQNQKKFKDKIKTIVKNKKYSDSHSSQAQQKKRKFNSTKKKMPKLKQIQIGNHQEEEFCKSFDHRSRKGQRLAQSQLSQIISHDLKDNQFYNQIYDVLCDDNDQIKSHKFYFSSGTESGSKDSFEIKSAKVDNRNEFISRSMSKSYVDQSSEISGQKRGILGRSLENSFFKSGDGIEYFCMSKDNPLNF